MHTGCRGSRIVYAMIRASLCNLFVVSVYVPHAGRQNPTSSDTLDDLDNLLCSVPCHDSNGRHHIISQQSSYIYIPVTYLFVIAMNSACIHTLILFNEFQRFLQLCVNVVCLMGRPVDSIVLKVVISELVQLSNGFRNLSMIRPFRSSVSNMIFKFIYTHQTFTLYPTAPLYDIIIIFDTVLRQKQICKRER